MTTKSQPFSSFGVSDALRKFLGIFEDPGLAENIAPRPLKAFVETFTPDINVFLNEKQTYFVRLVGTHLGVAEDGTLGLVCIDASEDMELFIPIELFTCWHAETPRDWSRRVPSEGEVEGLRFVLRKEILELERLLEGQ